MVLGSSKYLGAYFFKLGCHILVEGVYSVPRIGAINWLKAFLELIS